MDFLQEMVRLQDEPIADPVCVPVYFVSKLARDNGVVVCQVGEGADELFWGYPGWKASLEMQRLADLLAPQVLKRLVLGGLRVAGKGEGTRYELLRRGSMDQPVFWGGAEAFNEAQKQRILSPRLRKRFASLTSWEVLRPIRERFEQQAWDRAPLNWMSYLDLNFRLPDLLLMRVDKMSMGVSLEARVPFLDHKFVELAMGIPAAVKTRHGILKYILKKAVRGVIPDELIDRKKQGFSVPVQEWYSTGLRERMRLEIEGLCDHTDLLDPIEVRRLIARGRGLELWYLLNLAMWWKTFIA
jgi:asparagine synthase (glutamine-hydrolysing)